jgi:hypothetical protein
MNYEELRSLGYTKDGKVYLKSILGQPDRIIGDVKAGEQESIDYFIRRFELIRYRVNSMLEAIETAENKGSYLMQVLHLKELLKTFNAIGPFEELQNKLEEAETRINTLIEGNRVRNLEIKIQLLQKAREALNEPTPRDVIRVMKEVRFSWMTVGSAVKEQDEELEAAFQEITNQYLVIRDKFTAERTVEIEIRRQKLQFLLDTAAKLNTYQPEVEQSFYKFKKLEEEWKAVGNIPKVYYGPLYEQFKRIKKTIAKYARKTTGGPRQMGPKPIIIPRNYPAEEEHLYENLRRRVALIEEAKGLLRLDLRQANEMAKEVQARWKMAGQIPQQFKSEVFNQYNAISDRIFESSYLARVVHTKFPDFRMMSSAEQLQAKIEAMDEIIIKEDMNVKVTQAEFDFMSEEERNLEDNKARFARLHTSVRKLKMKNKILFELRRDFEQLQSGGNSYGNRGYSYGNRSSGYSQQGRDYQSGGGGYRREGGYNNRDNGYGSRPAYSGNQERSDSFGNRNYQQRDSSGRDNGYGNRDAGYERSSYGNRDNNRDGYGSREGGYQRSYGSGENRYASGSGERRQYGERNPENGYQPRQSGEYRQRPTHTGDSSYGSSSGKTASDGENS